MKKSEVLGILFDSISFDEALDLLESYLNEPHNHIVVTPNPEGVMQARRNPAFKDALSDADLRLADGTGIVLASRYIGNPLPERVRGVDTIFALLERLKLKDRKTSAYFLGGTPGIGKKAKAEMEARFPNLSVIGHHHGYFDATEEQMIIDEIDYLKPDILLVCIGMPRAEIWAATNRHVKARLTMCLGGTLDVMAGKVKIAPAMLRKLGLEWLFRLVCQPSRIKRQLDIPRFVLAVLKGGRVSS